MTTANQTQGHWALPDEWDSHKETISDLYWDQDKTLKDVAEIMRVQYGFCATERMYKARFKKWGLTKYMKADEVAHARSQAIRGKIIVPVIRGRVAGPKRLKQQISRRLPREFATLVGSEAAPAPFIWSSRRAPMSLPTTIDPPSEFKIVEGCLKFVTDFAIGKVETRFWDPHRDYLPEDEVDTWGNNLVLSRVLIERGKFKDGFRMLNVCMKDYTPVIERNGPLLMIDTYLAILNLSRARFDLAEAVLGYIAALYRIRHGPTHPYTRLWSALKSVGMAQARQYCGAVLKAQMHILGAFFDPMAEFILYHEINLARQLHFWGHVSAIEAEATIRDVIRRRELKALPDTLDFVCYCKAMIAFIYVFDGNFERSTTFLDEIEPYVRSPPEELTMFTTYEYYNQRCRVVKERPGSTYQEIKAVFEARLNFARDNAGPVHSFTTISVTELDWQYGLANDVEASQRLHDEFDFKSTWDTLCKKAESKQPDLGSAVSSEPSLESTLSPEDFTD